VRDYKPGSVVWLVEKGRVVTRFMLDIPPEILIEEINSGRMEFRHFGRGQKLVAVQQDQRVLVCVESCSRDLNRILERSIPQPVAGTVWKKRSLTVRQRQVLEGLVIGQTLAQIGLRLGIRERSVRHHVDALKSHYGAISLGQLVARAAVSAEVKCTPPQGGTGAGRQSKHPKIV
jgi:DNA-binding CsgD family transcriptional regulator